jgi:multiple sugar transport system ATP-binding protein
MAGLTISNVRKAYGPTKILKGIDLSIADGEFLILVGPSGCGKSTLLNMIAGLDTITEGEIRIGDRIVNDVSPKDRDIAMVFQSYALYPSMTVAENIAFALKMKKVPKAERDATVERVSKMLQLDTLLDRRPAQLSGGQRQRVAMGRALARNPQIFLFDEPLSNLDAKLRVEMRAEIKALHQRLKTTIVYVTHDQVEAMTLGDRIAVMKDGLVQQFGTPAEIYARPANMYVASFIGSPTMSFLSGRLVADETRWFVELDGTTSRLAVSSVNGATNGMSVVAGVRPEHFVLAAGAADALSVAVDMLEPTGPDTFVTGSIGTGKVTMRFSAKQALTAGQSVAVSVDTSAISLFDVTTQQRLIAGPAKQ